MLHVGPVKTGTTALAKYFSVGVRQNLLPEHIIYPTDELWFSVNRRIAKHGHVHKLLLDATQQRNGMPFSPELDAEFAKVRAESERRSGERITSIFVCEGAGHRIPLASILATMNPHFDQIDVIANVRRQDAAVPSWISQQVKDWDTDFTSVEIQDYIATGRVFEEIFDYQLAQERFAPKPGERHSFTQVPYLEATEGQSYVLDVFLKAIDEPLLPQLYADGAGLVNRSLSKPVLEQMGALKLASRASDISDRQIHDLQDQFYDLFRRFEFVGAAERREPTDAFNPWVISPRERLAIREHYRQSNTAFFAQLDRTNFPEQWQELESLLLSQPSNEFQHITRLMVDVTGVNELDFPSKKSALSVAELAGYNSLEECHYLRWTDTDGWQRYCKTSTLELRSQTGLIGSLRRVNRQIFFAVKERFKPLRKSLPTQWILRIRGIYETSMSETKVVPSDAASPDWTTWAPETGDALMIASDNQSPQLELERAQLELPHLTFRKMRYATP